MKHPNIFAASSAAALAMGATVSPEYRPVEFGRKGPDDGPEVDIKQLSRELKAATDKVKEFAEDAKGRLEAGEKLSTDAKEKADEALSKFNELSATMTEIEQKLARRGELGTDGRKTVGQLVTEDEAIKAFMERAPSKGSVSFATKAIITSLTTDADGSAGDLIVPDRQSGLVAPPERRMTVRDLITPGRTASNAIQYVKETGFTNNAAPTAETAQKPQSELKFDLMTLPVATIAHWVQASKQILSDVPMLQSYIDGRLRYGLAYAEELQLLKGDGTGSNLLGMIPQATAYAAPGGLEAENMLDQLRYAMLQAVLAEYPATGHVLNPIDWARIETMKDNIGRYIIGDPASGAAPTLWRLPVVETPAMTVDKFLTGAFKLACQLFDREDANVELSTEDRDNFVKNLVTIRGEERVGLAVYRPEALVYGSFGNVPG
ncbi:phage major capsid protein [Sphingomonas koreensis]|uniref:phage major capsid protein n=1 Tax=Sphingomonas koreensis TaxID=93064 RepID=UPI000F7E3FA5|nr:phage major capsid protein [Sphingomonas koreensis]RSU21211.1 phage major capsid protein [Sphingomonas koreensis]RSU32224.1 phage major capsid protein [Sphingomonas koreensis]RSU35718.1 phage major capsid protein [Sphingomonas koreensis]RSU49889.1 phage major capsid protein [Sphingomonas koreensis]RSU83486.1 phage major capsid protein [Sphingomonas koreensis]